MTTRKTNTRSKPPRSKPAGTQTVKATNEPAAPATNEPAAPVTHRERRSAAKMIRKHCGEVLAHAAKIVDAMDDDTVREVISEQLGDQSERLSNIIDRVSAKLAAKRRAAAAAANREPRTTEN